MQVLSRKTLVLKLPQQIVFGLFSPFIVIRKDKNANTRWFEQPQYVAHQLLLGTDIASQRPKVDGRKDVVAQHESGDCRKGGGFGITVNHY